MRQNKASTLGATERRVQACAIQLLPSQLARTHPLSHSCRSCRNLHVSLAFRVRKPEEQPAGAIAQVAGARSSQPLPQEPTCSPVFPSWKATGIHQPPGHLQKWLERDHPSRNPHVPLASQVRKQEECTPWPLSDAKKHLCTSGKNWLVPLPFST